MKKHRQSGVFPNEIFRSKREIQNEFSVIVNLPKNIPLKHYFNNLLEVL